MTTVRHHTRYQRTRDVAVNGVTYRVTIKAMQTAFGDYTWNVTDVAKGKGRGGFADTIEEAEARVREWFEEQSET